MLKLDQEKFMADFVTTYLANAASQSKGDGCHVPPIHAAIMHARLAWGHLQQILCAEPLMNAKGRFLDNLGGYPDRCIHGRDLMAACQSCYQKRNENSTTELLCTRAPHGWRCTRGQGHNGPCAAIENSLPTEPGSQTQTFSRYSGPDLRRMELIPAPPLKPGQKYLRIRDEALCPACKRVKSHCVCCDI